MFLHAPLCLALNSLSNLCNPPSESLLSELPSSDSPEEPDNVERLVSDPALSSSLLCEETDVSTLPGANSLWKIEVFPSSSVSGVSCDRSLLLVFPIMKADLKRKSRRQCDNSLVADTETLNTFCGRILYPRVRQPSSVCLYLYSLTYIA
jgi:hypothetical protein